MSEEKKVIEKVSVDAAALREVLSALNNPGSPAIREMQATRNIAELTGVINPINLLIQQFNEEINK